MEISGRLMSVQGQTLKLGSHRNNH
jgi:hypothetical protein